MSVHHQASNLIQPAYGSCTHWGRSGQSRRSALHHLPALPAESAPAAKSHPLKRPKEEKKRKLMVCRGAESGFRNNFKKRKRITTQSPVSLEDFEMQIRLATSIYQVKFFVTKTCHCSFDVTWCNFCPWTKVYFRESTAALQFQLPFRATGCYRHLDCSGWR